MVVVVLAAAAAAGVVGVAVELESVAGRADDALSLIHI